GAGWPAPRTRCCRPGPPTARASLGCRRAAAASTRSSTPPSPLVIHGDPEASGVVAQEVVVDAEVQPARRAHPHRALVVADEKVVVRVADAADQRRGWTAGDRTAVVARRVALAPGTVLAVPSPTHATRRPEDTR